MTIPADAERLIDWIPVDRLSIALGIQHELVAEGHVRSTLHAHAEHHNPWGKVHGGVLYAMADTGMGRAVASVLAANARCTTLMITAQYLEATPDGEVVAENVVVHQGAKVMTTECTIRSADGGRCAAMTGLFYCSVPNENS